MCHKITFGDGWVVLKKMFSAKDVEMARERLFSQKLINTIETFVNQDDLHNNYGGLTWGLLSRGRIFTKMAAHPIIMQVSQHLLGDNCRLSSFAANTVLPGTFFSFFVALQSVSKDQLYDVIKIRLNPSLF